MARLEALHAFAARQQRCDALAADALRPRQHRVEHRPAGIGIDFDEAERVALDVEVVAEEHAPDPAHVVTGDGRRRRQRLLAPRRQRHHLLHCPDHRLDAMQLCRRHEHGIFGEDMRAALAQQCHEPRIAQLGCEGRVEGPVIETDAETGIVQHIERSPAGLAERAGADSRPGRPTTAGMFVAHTSSLSAPCRTPWTPA
ncbi:hypothetical protein ACE0DR_18650 [Azotobacter sp. CWF10]